MDDDPDELYADEDAATDRRRTGVDVNDDPIGVRLNLDDY